MDKDKKLNAEEIENVNGGCENCKGSRTNYYRKHHMIHGICKEDHDKGVKVGSYCGGEIVPSHCWGNATYECTKCGEWYDAVWRSAESIFESGDCFNLDPSCVTYKQYFKE